MVNYRYQLLLLKRQSHHARDCRIRALQFVTYGILLCLLILYYGYQRFNTAATTTTSAWHAPNEINRTATFAATRLIKATTADHGAHTSAITTSAITTSPITTATTKTTTATAITTRTQQAQQQNTSNTATTSSGGITTTTTLTTTRTTSTTTTTSTPTPTTTVSSAIENYYVYSPQCRMPRVDPFTPPMRKFFKPMAPVKCATDVSLVRSVYNSTTRRYTLQLNASEIAAQYKRNWLVTCCYSEIVRSGGDGAYADTKAKVLPCKGFGQNFLVPAHIDGIIVTCNAAKKGGLEQHVLQKDAFSFVHYKNLTNISDNSNNTTNANTTTNNAAMPSLLLIGVDSLSRFNFRRNMPKTFQFLTDRNWFELEGYNKVADNTFPNLMALLTGYNQSEAYARCKPTTVGGLDACPMIWKHFQSAGYRTAYAEDIVTMSTFNYNKRGFRHPPTDHYPRPLMLAMEKQLKIVRKARLPYCLGRRQYAEYIYDYAQQLADCYRDEPVFGLFWTNSFSHNHFNIPSSMDVRMRRYFDDFERSGVLNTSIVFFFSDHGIRFGSVLEMPEGFLEERLPMFFIWLPEAFRQAHPQLARSLRDNRNRLTTPFDIYMTMIHLLQLGERPLLAPLKLAQYHADGCKNCQSVLRDVPAHRGCSDVGIPEHWCTCVPYATLHPNDKLVQQIAKDIIANINAYLKKSKTRNAQRCSVLGLKKVVGAEMRMDDMANGTTSHTTTHTYRIKFITTPKPASFQATINYNAQTQAVNVAKIEDISRLNRYAEHSKCVHDSLLKKYCICNNATQPSAPKAIASKPSIHLAFNATKIKG